MLHLISVGLHDQQDLSLRAVERSAACSKLYLEAYTTKLFLDKARLEKIVGKPVTELSRAQLENGMRKIVQEAREQDIGILVGGDALAATTHLSLLQACRRLKVRLQVTHGSSVFTAVAETGLSLYKFGETVTLPFWERNYRPTEFSEKILRNKQAGLHTLILLDTKSGARHMTVREALAELREIEQEKGQGLFLPDTKLIACTRLGADDQAIACGSLRQLEKSKRLQATPAVLILPGRLEFYEEEFLAQEEAHGEATC